jgi:methionyl-tRNA synthetase
MTLFDQTCPHCQITEAAGGYCTSCEHPTLPEWIHPKNLSVAQRAARTRQRPSTATKSPPSPKSEAAA